MAFERRDREADAVNGNRSFENQITIQFGGNADFQPPVFVADLLEGNKFARAVNVSLHDVTVKAAGRGERAF